jgi:hypothetical protein
MKLKQLGSRNKQKGISSVIQVGNLGLGFHRVIQRDPLTIRFPSIMDKGDMIPDMTLLRLPSAGSLGKYGRLFASAFPSVTHGLSAILQINL